MPQLSADARDLNWLIANFAKRTPGVAYAMVVSADGLPIASPSAWIGPKPTNSPRSPWGWPA